MACLPFKQKKQRKKFFFANGRYGARLCISIFCLKNASLDPPVFLSVTSHAPLARNVYLPFQLRVGDWYWEALMRAAVEAVECGNTYRKQAYGNYWSRRQQGLIQRGNGVMPPSICGRKGATYVLAPFIRVLCQRRPIYSRLFSLFSSTFDPKAIVWLNISCVMDSCYQHFTTMTCFIANVIFGP